MTHMTKDLDGICDMKEGDDREDRDEDEDDDEEWIEHDDHDPGRAAQPP